MIEISLYNDELTPIKRLWDDIFEDSEAFTEYYFENICNKNDIVVASENNQIIGMVHLNYYDAVYYGRDVKAVYIVGVAVKKQYRRKGIMRKMLEFGLEYAGKQGAAFAFLMPKRDEYYRGLGFEKIYTTKKIKLRLCSEFDEICHVEPYMVYLLEKCSHVTERISLSVNNVLADRYRVFNKRSKTYLEQMQKEHKCQNGGVYILCGDEGYEDIMGVFSYDKYDDSLYVDRLEFFYDCFDIFLEMVFTVGMEEECGFCNIVLSEDLYNKVFLYEKTDGVKWLEEKGLVEELSDGYGIMARSAGKTSDETISIKAMRDKSFFDEIV